MNKKIFGVEVNSLPELNIDFVKKDVGFIENDAINLYSTDFVTKENVKEGTKLSKLILPEISRKVNQSHT